MYRHEHGGHGNSTYKHYRCEYVEAPRAHFEPAPLRWDEAEIVVDLKKAVESVYSVEVVNVLKWVGGVLFLYHLRCILCC
jgi:hypothetical protein